MDMISEILHTGIETLTFGAVILAVYKIGRYKEMMVASLKAADKSRGLIHKEVEELKPMKEDVTKIKMFLKMQPNGLPD